MLDHLLDPDPEPFEECEDKFYEDWNVPYMEEDFDEALALDLYELNLGDRR